MRADLKALPYHSELGQVPRAAPGLVAEPSELALVQLERYQVSMISALQVAGAALGTSKPQNRGSAAQDVGLFSSC